MIATMEEEPSVIFKLFKYNMHSCVLMMLLCTISAVLAFNKTYNCPVNTYMLRDSKLCVERGNASEAILNEDNKITYLIIFVISTPIFTINTIIYIALHRIIENDGKTGQLLRYLK